MGLAAILLIGGAMILLWLFLWVRQRQTIGVLPAAHSAALPDPAFYNTDQAVLIASEQARLLFISPAARALFSMDTEGLTLEDLAARVQPVDLFLERFAAPGPLALRIAERWAEGESYPIPSEDGLRMVMTLREASSAGAPGAAPPSLSRTVEVVSEIGERIHAGLGLEQTLQTLLSILRQVLQADAGEISLWDAQRQRLTPRGWVGEAGYVVQLLDSGGQYEPGEGITGWVVQHRQPLLVTDRSAPDAVRPKLTDNPYACFAAVPLIQGGQLIGTLEMATIRPGGLGPGDLALLQAVSSPAAAAITNAELYAEQQQRVEDFASLQQVSYSREVPASFDAAIAEMGARVARLLGAEMCGILLHDERRRALVALQPYHGLPPAIARTYVVPLGSGTPGERIFRDQDLWETDDLAAEENRDALGMGLLADTAGVSATALTPLIVGNRRIGMLQASRRQGGRAFSIREMANLRLLAAQVAVVVEDIRQAQEEQRRDAEISGVQEITQALGTITGEDEFFASATERIARLMSVEMCGVLLLDEAGSALRARAPFYGRDEALLRGYALPVDGENLLTRIWKDEDSWLSNNALSDKVIVGSGLGDVMQALDVRRLLVAAMESGGRKLGMLQVANPLDGREFTEQDARLLYIFAAQIASLIDNARLFREAQRRAQEADDLRLVAERSGQILSTEDSFLPTLEVAARILQCEAVFVNVLDQTSGTLVTYPRYLYGASIEAPVVQNIYSPGFDRSVAISRRPYLSNRVLEDARVLPSYRTFAQQLGIQSAAIVPLVVGDQTLGEMGAMNSQRGGFTANDLRTLSAIGVQIAAALDRIRIYETTGQNLSRRLLELDAISRVSSELAQTLDFDSVLDVARLEAVRASDADGNSVAMLRPANAWRDPSLPEIARRQGDRRLGDALAEIELAAIRAPGEPVLVEDYAAADLRPPSPDMRSAVAAAFSHEDQVVGVFHLWHSLPGHFDPRAAAFLATLASKASLSYGNYLRFLENQERSDRLRRRVEQLNQIFELGQMLQSNVDSATMLEAIAYSVQQSCGFDAVVVTLADDSTPPMLRRQAQAGLPVHVFEETRQSGIALPQVEGLLARDAYRISESHFLPFERIRDWFIEGLEVFNAQFAGQKSMHPSAPDDWHDGDMLLIPIRGVAGDLLGVMSLDRPVDARRPDRGSIEVLEIFAHQAAATIENNRLYMASLRSAEQEARLNEVMEAISTTLDVSRIVEGVAQGVLRLLPFERMTLALLDSEQQGFDVLSVAVAADNTVSVRRDHRASLENTAMGRSFREGRDYLYLANLLATEPYEDLRGWQVDGERSSLVVPMITGGQTLGALHIGSSVVSAGGFEEYRALIRRIANLTAVAVQNARLFDQAVNLRLFNESIFQSIQQGLVVLDREGRILIANDFIRDRYLFGPDAAGRSLFEYRPALGGLIEPAFREVIGQGGPRELNNVRLDLGDEALLQNIALYPLLAGDTARGVVVLIDDVTERARLERDIAVRSSQLEALTEVSSRITAALRRSEVIGLVLDELERVIGYDSMAIWRRQGDELLIEAARGFEVPDPPTPVPIDDSKRMRALIDRQRVLAASVSAYDSLPGLPRTRSWLGVPLVRQGQVIGMVTLSSMKPDFYDAQAEQAAVAFCNQVAVALANADLFEEAIARTQRLSLLNRVSMQLAQSLDTENILEVSLREIAGLLGIERARAYLFDRDNRSARVIVEMPRGDAPPETVLPISEAPLIASLWERPQTVVAEDVRTLEDAGLKTILSERGLRAYMLLPMSVGGQTTGAFELEADDRAHVFDPEKIDLSLIIASQAAIAILNSSLLEQTLVRTRELETLLEAAQATSTTLDLNEVFRSVVRLTIQALDVDECAVMLYDNIEERLIVEVADVGPRNLNAHLGEGTQYDLFQYTAKTRSLNDGKISILNRADPAIDRKEREEMVRQGVNSRMLVPLVVGDASIGLLQADVHTQTREFNHREMRMAQALGAQAAAAIENARLSTETAAQVAQSLVINELSRAISSTMDVDQMVRIIREQVPELTSAREIYLALYDASTGQIRFPMAIRDEQPIMIPPRMLGNDEVSYIIRTRRLLMLGGDNPRPEDMRRNMGISENEDGASRYLGVPLAAGDMVAGVLAVRDHGNARPFGLNDQRIMTTIGAQLGAMIQNSNLFSRVQNFADELNARVQERTAELQQERDRLDALYRITSELGRTLDMTRVLNGALDLVSEAIGAAEAVVLLRDAMDGQMYARAIRHADGRVLVDEDAGISGAAADRLAHPAVPVGEWLMTQDDRAALLPDLRSQPFWKPAAPDAARWRSALAVSLESEGAPLGAMVFFSDQPDAFTDPQRRLVAAAAGQVSSAVKNTDLYALVNNQATRMADMLQTEREEAEKNSAILQGIADGVLLADSSGVVVLFNAAAERILEVPRQAALGQRLDHLRALYGGEAAWVQALSGYVLNPPRGTAERPGEDLVVDRLDTGRRVVNIRSSPVYNGDQFLGTVSLFRDVTRDVEVDRMKSEFISNVSHELRTPMTSIKGFADLLLMGAGGGVSADQERYLRTIKSNADRLAELVNDLLNISRIDAGSEQLALSRIDMADLLEQAVEYNRGRLEFQRKGLQLTTDLPMDLTPVLADRIKIMQVVSNVIDNACNYTNPGGHVDVRARLVPERGGLLVEVQDDGIGIPEAFRTRIWNRFERYEEHALVMEVAGTGLGLSIVRHLVELHHGEVWFESEEGAGTTFFILLPVDGPEAGLRPAEQPLAAV